MPTGLKQGFVTKLVAFNCLFSRNYMHIQQEQQEALARARAQAQVRARIVVASRCPPLRGVAGVATMCDSSPARWESGKLARAGAAGLRQGRLWCLPQPPFLFPLAVVADLCHSWVRSQHRGMR